MIHEVLRSQGSFDLRLQPDTPKNIVTQVREFARIVITSAHLTGEDLGSSAVPTFARYTGVILEPGDGRISGEGELWWLGSDSHAGKAIVDPVVLSGVTLSSALATLLPAGSALLPGSIDNTGLSTITFTPQAMSQRAAVEQAIAMAGASFRVNPTSTIDAALASTLHVTTPRIVVTDDAASWGDVPKGVEASVVVASRNARQYATKVVVLAQSGDGERLPTGEQSGTPTYLNPYGSPAELHRLIDAPTVPTASAADVAQQVLDLATVRQVVKVTCRHSDIGRDLRPGDAIYIYKPDQGFVDTANQVSHKGITITPSIETVTGISWPATSQFGYYLVTNGGTIIDITSYIMFEDDSDVELIIGQGSSLRGDVLPFSGPLGGADAAALRFAESPAKTFTPALTGMAIGTGGSAYNQATYIYANGMLNVWGRVVFGTSGVTLPTGTIGVGPPPGFTFAPPLTAVLPAGICYMNAGGVNSPGTVRAESSSLMRILANNAAGTYLAAANVSSTVPGTWANGNSIEYSYSVPVS